MRFVKSLVLMAGALSSCAAFGQVGFYTLATGQHMSDIRFNPSATPITVDSKGSATGSFSPLGYTLGGYYDFHSFGRFRLGADARFVSTSTQKGALAGDSFSFAATAAGGRVYSGLAGARLSTRFKVKVLPIHPYVEAAAGLVRTNYGVIAPGSPTQPSATGRYSNFAFTGMVGGDFYLLPILDLRLEGGSGFLSGGPASSTYPLQTFSIGVVFHTKRDPGQ